VKRAVPFYLLSAVLVLGMVGLMLDTAFNGEYDSCFGPTSRVLLPPFAVCGVLCLALAEGWRERVPVVLVLMLGAIAHLSGHPFGYRIPWEAAALGDVRVVISGQAAYQFANHGYFDTLECLAKPSSCIPDYPTTDPTFLPASTAVPEHGEYRHWLVPGLPVTDLPPGASRTSMRGFAYIAVPLDSRRRSFCGDDTGVVWQAPCGITPNVRDGRCDDPRLQVAN
jgi:hypothetical protein